MGGAKVSLVKFDLNGLLASMTTGENGLYTFASAEHVSFSGALVSVVLPGYFTETRYILMGQHRTLDFVLERAEAIPFGQTVRRQVGGEARCASLGYGGMGGAFCRRLALTVPASGALAVSLASIPRSPVDITILRPDGTIGVYASTNTVPLTVAIAVEAGSTYQIDAISPDQVAREFELTTTWQ